MGMAFHERRNVMQAAIEENGLQIAGQGAYGGSSFWMRAPEHVNTTQLAQALQAKGVLIEPGEPFFGANDAPNTSTGWPIPRSPQHGSHGVRWLPPD